MVKPDPRAARRHAAVFVILAAAFWWHRWIPLVLVVAFVAWLVVHKRLEGPQGAALRRAWQRGWPPAVLVLVAVTVATTALYWLSPSTVNARSVPIALNVLAVVTLALAYGSGGRRDVKPVASS